MTQSRLTGRSVLAAGIACTLLAYGSTLAQAPTSTNAIGWYTVLIRGHYSGDGKAYVDGASVTISMSIRDDSGRTGNLNATIPLVGDHFNGPASALGFPITVQGRVDAADPVNPDAIITDARIGATFVDSHGHTGRIAGTKLKPTTQPAG